MLRNDAVVEGFLHIFIELVAIDLRQGSEHLLHILGCIEAVELVSPPIIKICTPAGARTLDTLIKSQVLYQLSYGCIANRCFNEDVHPQGLEPWTP